MTSYPKPIQINKWKGVSHRRQVISIIWQQTSWAIPALCSATKFSKWWWKGDYLLHGCLVSNQTLNRGWLFCNTWASYILGIIGLLVSQFVTSAQQEWIRQGRSFVNTTHTAYIHQCLRVQLQAAPYPRKASKGVFVYVLILNNHLGQHIWIIAPPHLVVLANNIPSLLKT